MGKILGLDLGTNSIGWAIVKKDGSTFSLKDKGVRIFSEGVKIEKGIESSKAAERTRFRSARKLKFRRKLRKYETLKVLAKNQMCPLTLDEVYAWRKSNFKEYPLNPEFLKWLRTDEEKGINPYSFRDAASRKKVPLQNLGRAFYHIAQRRGFLSNRLDQDSEGIIETVREELLATVETESTNGELITALQAIIENYKEEEDKNVKGLLKKVENILKAENTSEPEQLKNSLKKLLTKSENLGPVKKGIVNLTQKMEEAKCKTLGQYFHHLYQQNRHKSDNKIRSNYTAREEHYLNEFEQICKTQKLDGIKDNEKVPEKRYHGIVNDLYRAIFYQRPLKSQKGLVGKCSFEKNKARCPVSHPDFEEFRALQFINSIKISKSPHEKKGFLSQEEKVKIWPKFTRKSKPHFDFEDIAKELTPKGEQRFFNYKNNTTVSGCPTIANFERIFGSEWKKKTWNYNTINKKGENVPRSVNYRDLWHILFTFDSKERLYDFAKDKLKLDNTNAKKFSSVILKKEYASLSLKAINKILPYLHEGLIYSYAVFLANIKEVVGKDIWNNEKYQKIIRSEIKYIIDNYNDNLKQESIVNGLIADFRENYNNADKNYTLDESDKKDIKRKTLSIYGKNHFENLPEEIQNKIIDSIEKLYQQQLKKNRGGEFIKRKRLDERITEFLIDNFDPDETALKRLYHPSDIDIFQQARLSEDGKYYLGSPVISSIKNPMAMRTMHQLKKLINTLIQEGVIDEETQVHIELARELNDANKRKAIQDWQNERRKSRNEFREKIKKLYKEECGKEIEPIEDDLLKYQLWNEQNHICLYTGKTIGICDFIGADPKFDLEHTIPKSLSYDNSQVNLTLCDIIFNRKVKQNKIPSELTNHEEILSRLAQWENKAEEYSRLFNSRKRPKGIETKEQKDKRIRDKHYFKLHHDYWAGKINRFKREDVPEGFKNSQIVDTGIITKYARAYLKSVFQKVYSVKGDAVAEFRKQWGLQEEYGKKERTNQIHHCIDAITIACMTKDKYDLLAKLYHADEENRQNEKREVLKELKPWFTFTEDIKNIEEQVLVSHHTPNNAGKQTKKKLRKRGKIQYRENGNPIFQQGATVRGSLHQATFYGSIKDPSDKKEKRKSADQETIYYVIRKELDKLSKKDIFPTKNNEGIIDPVVRAKFQEAFKNGTITFKKVQNKEVLKLKEGEVVWMNQEKGIPIKKVRVYASEVQNPLSDFKKHAKPFASKKEHKRQLNVQNEDNYCMVFYENNDGIRDFELISKYDFAKLKSEEEKFYPLNKPKTIRGKKNLLPLMNRNGKDIIVKKGTLVLFYERGKEEIDEIFKKNDLSTRLYEIEGLSIQRIKSSGKTHEYGVITFRLHNEARKSDDLKKLNYKPDGEFKVGEIKPTRKMNHNQFNGLIEGIDFKLTPTGRIKPIRQLQVATD